MDIKFTPILPNIDAFTRFDIGYVAEQALQEFAHEAKKEFDKTTETWKQPVRFNIRYDRGKNSVRIFTNDEIYKYVNEGTKPHAIRAAAGSLLRYRQGYTAKTMKGRIQAGQGGKSGGYMFSSAVMHPGISPRHFDSLIFQKLEQQGLFKKIFGRILSEYISKNFRG